MILHGPTIMGNYHDVANNYNAGFQWFAAGLQNLKGKHHNNAAAAPKTTHSTKKSKDTNANHETNNNKVVNNVTDEQQVIQHGPTVNGNYHDVANNYNAGFQNFAAVLLI